MREQSHKNEMSAALRGDFDRLRERGVAVTLAPGEPQPSAELTETEAAGAEDATPPDARGWLARLRGR